MPTKPNEHITRRPGKRTATKRRALEGAVLAIVAGCGNLVLDSFEHHLCERFGDDVRLGGHGCW